MIFLFNHRSVAAEFHPAVERLVSNFLLKRLIAGAFLAYLGRVFLDLRLKKGRECKVFLYVHGDTKSRSLTLTLGSIHKHPRVDTWALGFNWTVLSRLDRRLRFVALERLEHGANLRAILSIDPDIRILIFFQFFLLMCLHGHVCDSD